MDTKKRLRFEEYMAAAARAALVAEEVVEDIDFEEFDWVWDTLSELLERYNDAGKPMAERVGRRAK